MKIIYLMSLLTLLACGSPTPFKRGEIPDPVKSLSPSDIQPPEEPQAPVEPQNPPPEPTNFDKNFFNKALLPLLGKKCSLCHDNPAFDFESAKKMSVFKRPQESKLYQYSTGLGVQHRKIFIIGSAEEIALASWINGAVLQ